MTTIKTHRATFYATSLQKKVFSNLKNNGKDFSGRVTPLFPYMVNLPQKKGEDVMEGAATSAGSLEAEQASGNLYETEYTAVDSPLSEGNHPKVMRVDLKHMN